MFKQDSTSLELLSTVEDTLYGEKQNPKEIIEDIVSKLSTCKQASLKQMFTKKLC